MSPRLVLLSIVVLMTACHPPAGTVRNADERAKFKVEDSIFLPLVADGQVIGGDIVFADQPNLCDSVRSGYLPSRMKAPTLRIVRVTQTGYLAPDVGSYRLINEKPTVVGNYAFGALIESDLNCTQLSCR